MAPYRAHSASSAPSGSEAGIGTGEQLSRKDRRAADAAAAVAARSTRPDPRRWIARGAVLAALLGITVVLPATGQVMPGNGTIVNRVAAATAASGEFPSTIDALAAVPVFGKVPSALEATTSVDRDIALAVSRSEDRNPLPGCDGAKRAQGTNGELETKDLCVLWGGNQRLRADAAVALAQLNAAFKAKFGINLCISDAYRTIAEQRYLKRTKGGLAATPGKSNHGWGLAVDLCGQVYDAARGPWFRENAPLFGWVNPSWALGGGNGPEEKWHWEFESAVKTDGEYYG